MISGLFKNQINMNNKYRSILIIITILIVTITSCISTEEKNLIKERDSISNIINKNNIEMQKWIKERDSLYRANDSVLNLYRDPDFDIY